MRSYGRRRRRDEEEDDGEENVLENEEDEEDEDDSDDDSEERHREEQVCEKLSWREIAYTSFIWWASAGEKRRDPSSHPDTCADGEGDYFDPYKPAPPADADTVPLISPRPRRRRSSDTTGSVETDIVAYFHRVTGRLISVMADIVEEGDEEEDVFFSLEDVDRLGLDRYSEGDVKFVKGVCKRYFGREAIVEEGGWSCCAGLKWC